MRPSGTERAPYLTALVQSSCKAIPKAMLAELPVGELTKFFEENLTGHAANLPMRALLQAFADDRGIPL